MTDATAPKKHLAPLPKLLLDLGPLLLFFFANSYGGIYFATGAFMVATVVTLAISYYLIRRFPVMPIVTAVIVMVFGALTLWLHNDTFIKLKPTIIYVMFAVVLLVGLATGRPLFQIVLDGALHMKEEGWKLLTLQLGAVLSRDGSRQRIRLALLHHRSVGDVQDVRLSAADFGVRAFAGADHGEIRDQGSGGEELVILETSAASRFPDLVGSQRLFDLIIYPA
jgi:intracellular septation protein